MAELNFGEEIGSYRVMRRIGSGGVGSVYEVEHRQLGVRYALKAFTFESAHADEMKERFLSEGKILARLSHPGIVRVFDMDFDECRQTPYFVMDLVRSGDGRPVSLAEVDASGLNENRVAGWFVELASSLDYVHSQGVVHRDVKLNNVMLDSGDHAVLSDFGISRFVSEALRREVSAFRTMVATAADPRLLLGTRGYMAPELENGGEATAAADTYALGVMIFHLLTGVWYEQGSKALGLLDVFERPWGEVLPRMLSARPEDRPTQLSELATRITAAERGVSGSMVAPAPGCEAGSPRRSRGAVWILAAAAVVASVAFAWYLSVKGGIRTAPDELDELLRVDEIFEGVK